MKIRTKEYTEFSNLTVGEVFSPLDNNVYGIFSNRFYMKVSYQCGTEPHVNVVDLANGVLTEAPLELKVYQRNGYFKED